MYAVLWALRQAHVALKLLLRWSAALQTPKHLRVTTVVVIYMCNWMSHVTVVLRCKLHRFTLRWIPIERSWTKWTWWCVLLMHNADNECSNKWRRRSAQKQISYKTRVNRLLENWMSSDENYSSPTISPFTSSSSCLTLSPLLSALLDLLVSSTFLTVFNLTLRFLSCSSRFCPFLDFLFSHLFSYMLSFLLFISRHCPFSFIFHFIFLSYYPSTFLISCHPHFSFCLFSSFNDYLSPSLIPSVFFLFYFF